jgi:hypothetical protein
MIYKQTTKKLNKTVILKQTYILNTQHGSYFPHKMKAMVYGSLWIQQTLLQIKLPLLDSLMCSCRVWVIFLMVMGFELQWLFDKLLQH